MAATTLPWTETATPPLPSLSKHNQEPPPWLRTPAPTPEASVTSSRVSAAQASLPGSLAVGVAPPNPAQVSMSAVPPPADLDRGVDADTEDADGAYNLRLYVAIQYTWLVDDITRRTCLGSFSRSAAVRRRKKKSRWSTEPAAPIDPPQVMAAAVGPMQPPQIQLPIIPPAGLAGPGMVINPTLGQGHINILDIPLVN